MSKIKSALNRNKTFMLWFSSYLLMLLLPVTIYLALYLNVNTTAKAEVERANGMMLNQFLQFLDNSLREVDQAAFSIYNDAKIQSLMYKTKPLSSSSIYKIVDIQKDLRKYRLSNTNINNIYVYCKRSDMLVSIDDTFARTDTASFYKQLTDLPHEQWLSALQNTDLPAYRLFKQQPASSQRYFDKLTYSRPFPFAYTENMAGMVIITIDLQQLKQKFFKSSYSAADQYFIVDRDGSVLALNQNAAFPKDVDLSPLFSGGDGLKQGLVDVPGYTCLSVKSQVNDWIYVRFVDTAQVNKRIDAMNVSFIISISACLAIGTAIAFLLTRYNYNPLQHLKQLLVGTRGDLVEKESDFQYIIRQVQNLQVEKDSMQQALDTQQNVVRDALLLRIMMGEVWGAELDRACTRQGVVAEGPLAVVLAGLEEPEAGSSLSGEQQAVLVANLFTRVFNRSSLQGYVTEAGPGVVACLVVARGPKCGEDAMDDIRAGVNEANAILHAAKLSSAVTLAFSSLHSGVGEVHHAYTEARETLEYSWLTGSHAPLDYSEIRGKPSANGFMQQALQHDHHFINCIRALDFAGARRSLNDIIDMELTVGSYPVRLGKFRMYGLINMMIGAVGELGSTFDSEFFDRTEFIPRLCRCRTVQELRGLVDEILDKMDRLYSEQSKSKMQNGIQETIQFIERNYMDPNLSVAMIAGAMNLHPSYLTQLFKRETGHSTMDHIHLTRLKAAKELLDEHKIKDVATRVGYYDVRSLIRVFRKYEGITPSKFKEMGGPEEEAL